MKYQLDIEKYKKAIEKVVQRFADKGWEEIKVEELWLETSLPIDLILEVIKSGISVPSEVKMITHRGNILWKRQD